MNAYYHYETPIGFFTLACYDDALTLCSFGKVIAEGEYQETEFLKNAYQQLQEYFLGQRKTFDLKYHFLSGTLFQQKVWNALIEIPYGHTVSYQEIAKHIGSPKACRAVGGANNKNPIAIFIPCHRVVGANGQLVGYAGGLETKAYLIDLERTNL